MDQLAFCDLKLCIYLCGSGNNLTDNNKPLIHTCMKRFSIILCCLFMLTVVGCNKLDDKVHDYKTALQEGDLAQANSILKELKSSDLSTEQRAEVKQIEELFYEDALDKYIEEYEKLMKKGKFEKAFKMISEVDEEDFTLKQKKKIAEIAMEYASDSSILGNFITKLKVDGSTAGVKSRAEVTAPKASRAASNYTSTLRNVAMTDDYSWIICEIPLQDSDLYGLSKAQLRILRNTIYARHGRKFKSPDLQRYFSQFSWYYPTVNEVYEHQLSSTEKHNIRLIQAYE